MAYSSSLGLPQILIDFKSAAATAMIRSSRGIGTIILNDAIATDDTGVISFTVSESGDIPDGISDKSSDLIKKALIGTPARLNVFFIPNSEYEVTSEVESTVSVASEVFVVGVDDLDDPELSTEDHYETRTVEVPTTVTVTELVTATVTAATALKQIGSTKFNWICHPTGTASDQEDLAAWVKLQRKNENRTFKAVVANYAADNEGVVNFTTENIRVVNPAYTDALLEAGGDAALIDASIPQYVTYTAAEYTSRIMGILAGISLDRSATYYQLPEVVDCAVYDDISAHIDKGEFCLFDERDSNGVKIARGCNSLTTFTAKTGESFRYIKIVEALDMISDDISSTFRNDYVGKVLNTYDNKMLFIAAIMIYFEQLKGTVLDNSSVAENYVELDEAAHRDFAKVHSIDLTDYTEQQVLEINTGTQVFLRGRITPVNAMEDLELHFVL